MISKVNYYALVILMGTSCLVGCGKSVDADTLLSSEGELSLKEITALKESVSKVSEAVPIIKTCNDAVREAFAVGDPEKSHRPLDVIDALSIHLRKIIPVDSLTESQKETAESARNQLFVLISSFHGAYDRGENPDYQEIADEVQSLITKLESVLPESEREQVTKQASN